MSSSAVIALREAEAIYSKAVKAETEKEWDQAFKLYVKATEGFLHVSRLFKEDQKRTAAKELARKSLERAEKIKSIKRNLTPVTVNIFSEQEQFYVLKKSSLVNGIYFSLWDEQSVEIVPDTLLNDKSGQPPLSLEQMSGSPTWRRPQHVYPDITMISPLLLPQDIVQLIVEDCSVCASISVCMEHHIRFDSKLGFSSLYPQDSNNFPRLSESGQYIFRMLYNGAYRRIGEFCDSHTTEYEVGRLVIDDALPFYPDGTLMCMSTGTKHNLWPSLVEKAYMKLMGGYDFLGSNSCIDIHTIAGWIPEHIEIKSPTFVREKTWSRILEGFSQGHCVLTVGTADREDTEWRGMRLLASHCQAVIDVREIDGERIFTILDSRIHHGPPQVGEEPPYESRVLHIPWSDVCTIFEGVYLSWDPARFKNQVTFHGIWKSNDGTNQPSIRQLKLNIQPSNAEREIWVLLTRHITITRQYPEFISLRVNADDTPISLSENTIIASKGRYTSSPHVLVRTSLAGSATTLSILASHDGTSDDVAYTITTFSNYELSWDTRIPCPRFSTKANGVFTAKNAGGNCTYPTYMINPQYHLRIHPPTDGARRKVDVLLALEGPRDIPLNVSATWSQGQRITELIQNEVAMHSGAYSYGLARVAQELPVGDYTLVLSAFELHHTGAFTLTVESTHRFDLDPIPQEGAGMYNNIMRGTWDSKTAGGAPNFGKYSMNPSFEFEVNTPTQVIIRLHLTTPAPATALNVSVFAMPTRTLIATSGQYVDTQAGVVTPRTLLGPGKYAVVPSTWYSGTENTFRINYIHMEIQPDLTGSPLQQVKGLSFNHTFVFPFGTQLFP